MTDYLKAFEASAASLRDNVLAALEGGALRTAQDGLGVYQDLLVELADHHDQLSGQLGVSPLPSRIASGYGAEWDALIQDLYEVVTAAARGSTSRPWIDVIDWLRSLARIGITKSHDPIYFVALMLLEQMWRANLEQDTGLAPPRLAAFLLRLSELGTFTLSSLDADATRRDTYEARLARSFTLAVKESYDAGHSEAAKLAVEYFAHTRRAREEGNFNTLRDSCLVVLYAWTLLRDDQGGSAEQSGELRMLLASKLSDDTSIVDVGMRTLSERNQNEIGWDWWELEGAEPIRGGFLQLSHYVVLSLIQLSRQSPVLFPDALNDEYFNMASRLKEGMQDYRSEGRQRVRALDPRTDEQLEAVAERIDAYVQSFERVCEERMARMDIDPERVERFRQALADRLRSADLRRSIIVGLSTEITEDETIANFGLDSLYPKWFFAETHVHAEPERLGGELADSLIRGEEGRIVETVLSGVGALEVTLGRLLEEASRWAESRSGQQVFVITNSWQAMQQLRMRSENAADESSDADQTPFGAAIFRVFDDRDPFVAMFTSPDGLSVSIAASKRRVEGDVILTDLKVLLGVSRLGEDDIQEIRSRKDETDELRLRSSVRVRMLERLRVEVVDSAKMVVYSLPEDAW